MTGMTVEEGINQVYGGGGHVVILGAGTSIASTSRNTELNGKKLLDEAFRKNNTIPKDFKTLTELWNWHKPLIEAEENKKTRANS